MTIAGIDERLPEEEPVELFLSMIEFERAVDRCLEEKIKFFNLWNMLESSYLSMIVKRKEIRRR